jgi:DNA-binding NarL/FixJ family response regulator
LEDSSVGILVVDDFEPFRRFVCSTLGKNPELRVIGEASDGLEAVQKAEELQPDLIVLDIGLPSLSGIEAARRIRELSPQSKIVFLSQESSAEVVQEALGLGGQGYLVKTHAASELLAAVEAVRQGGQFISKGLSGRDYPEAADIQTPDLRRNEALPSLVPRKSGGTRSHEVEFYSGDAALVVGFSDFIRSALRAGNAVIVVSTQSHRESLVQRLQEHGVDIVAASEQGRYLAFDAADILSTFMRNDLPDPVRFRTVVGDLIAAAARGAAGPPSRVAICGECASILWAQGKADAAVQVEQLCNQLTKQYEIDILCGLSLSNFHREEDRQIFQKICSAC